MIEGSVIVLFSAFVSVFASLIVLSIFRKVYQEDYKKPWLFISISTLFLASSQFLRFSQAFFGFVLINPEVTSFFEYTLEFIAIATLTYALLFEYFILKYFKGKFIKMKFIPVQEGTLGGDLDINVSEGHSYVALKKDNHMFLEEFASATRKGFEGFLLTEISPRDIRLKYGLQKTPVAWIHHTEENGEYVKANLDENSDIVEPIQLNNIVSFIDNFLEQSEKPFIMLDLKELNEVNNFPILADFLRYVSGKVQKYRGVFICIVPQTMQENHVVELKEFMNELN